MRIWCGNTVSARGIFAEIRGVWILILALSFLVSHLAHAEQAAQEFKADEAWLATVQKNIEEQEYHPSKQMLDLKGGGETKYPKWHINNRAQGFRSAVSVEGWEIVPRPPAKKIDPKDPTKQLQETAAKRDDAPKWYWRYKFSSVARGSERTRLSAPEVRDENDTVYLTYSPSVSEWYKNSKAGIEQGFEIKERPFATKRDELVLVGDIETDLKALNPTREKIGFSKDGVEVVQYAGLKVIDASGRVLPSWLSYYEKGRSKRLLIHIEDSQAMYPVVVDPLATSPSWTGESDQAEAIFGSNVSTAGDVNGDGFSDVIVGAYFFDNGQSNEGRAFLYLGSSSGLSLTASWSAEGNQGSALYGLSVSTAGDINGDGYSDVLVGAYQFDNGHTNEGRAFAYLGSASGLSPTPHWTGESDQGGASYGICSSAGDINRDGYSDVLIGAPLFTNGEASEGRVYLYLGSSSGLSSVASGTLESDQASAFYGTSVSTAGDLNGDGYSDVVVGASGFDNVEANEGMAFVYLGTATGLSTSPHWTGESNQGSARYGSSVGSAGDVNGDGFSDLVVGAEYYANGQASEGGAFLYLGSASGLSTSSNWTGESNQASARYGAPVGSAGDINGDGYSDVIVGAHYFDNNEIDEGRAYLYLGSSSGLSAMPNWTGESDQDDAYYGFSAGTAGDVDGDGYSDVVVGAYFFDNGESDEGKAFLYRGSAATLSTSTSWTGESDQMDASYGTSVSSAGDVNGDGYSDVIVGARNFANGEPEEGRAYVYLGTASGLSTTASWTAESDYGYVNYGGDVSTAGDVNGDGYSDIIVGASNFNNGEAEEGQAFLYLGSSSGLSTTPNWTGESNQVSGQYGCSVSTAGDVNGDGYSDVIVGACYFDNGESNEGQAYLYLGSASGLATTASWTGESDQAEAIFGSNVSTAGDVNGDGFSDVLIGASFYDNDEEDEGRAYLYLGSSSGLSTTASWIGESNQASSEYSYGISTAGDVNGDSFSDVIVGAWWYENGETREGRAYLYLGSATGLSTTANWTGESNQTFALYGRSVDTAGDVNGDGFSDVLVGVSGFSNGQGSEGRTYLYLGSATGLASTSSWTGEGNQVSASYGSSVSTAGDVNGDGYSDVIVGAFFVSNGQGNEGQAYLYLGNEPGGRAVAARQLTTANTPLQVLGNSGSSSYKIRLTAYSPAGRSWVRLIWESKPLGTPFDNTGLGIGAWSDSGIAGVTRTETVTGLTLNTPYHWRARVETFPQIYSSWYSVGNNGAQEGDIRYYLAPTATPTAVPTSTATPPATSTPTPTMTPTPQGGDATPIPPTPTPVTIAPGARNLPPPQIRVDGDDATITLPLVTPNLTGRARTQALKLLLERGLTKAQANKALKDLIVTYVVKITNVGVSSVEDVEPLGRSIIIRSRNNQISRQNLPPGNYSTSYTVQIATRKPPVLLGTTKSSESTRFSVPRQPE